MIPNEIDDKSSQPNLLDLSNEILGVKTKLSIPICIKINDEEVAISLASKKLYCAESALIFKNGCINHAHFIELFEYATENHIQPLLLIITNEHQKMQI